MPTGVYDRTKSKPNAGLFRKGEHRSPATEIRKGQRMSPDTEFHSGEGPRLSWQERNCDSPEWREKQSLSHKGLHSSPETQIKPKQRLSPATEFKPLVPGGVSTEEMLLRASPEYVQWRKAVYMRDDYTCQRCGTRGVQLEAHHIKRFATHPELRFVVSNGITLCKSCHRGGDAHDEDNYGAVHTERTAN